MKEIYTDSFYDVMKEKKAGCKKVVQYIVDIFHPESVVDIGCGIGLWLSLFKECGVSKVHGYDGAYVSKDKLILSDGEFTPFDLTKKIQVNKRYDMTISLEVAEHIEEQYADQFITNLTEFSDIVLFSAAIPGQGGDGHVNEQWPSYWRTKFEKNGFSCCDYIREYFWDIEGVDYYYRQNILLYINNEKKELIEKLQCFGNKYPIDIVHPVMYLKYKFNLELMTLLMNEIVSEGRKVKEYLEKNEIQRLAIYGTGRIGRYFYEVCKKIKVKIPFCIDVRVDYRIENIPTLSYQQVKDDMWGVDCIVVASGYHYSEMQKNLAHLKRIKVASLWEILNSCLDQDSHFKINGV